MKNYYAIISNDNSGPALGIGQTEQQAWDNSVEYGATDRDGLKAVQITGASYAAIVAGNPDAVETAR